MNETFLEAINERKLVWVTFDSHEKGQIERMCVPFDFGPSGRYRDGKDRYHFFDLDSPEGQHNLSILPEQVVRIVKTAEAFNPDVYVTWKEIKWHYARDWGTKS